MKSEWISVKNKLPEKSDEYIVADESNNVFSLIYRTDIKWCYQADNKGYHDLYEHNDITHWMPLPDAPK